MIYIVMKKLIQNENSKLSSGQTTNEDYAIWKSSMQNKLDIFFAKDRLSQAQYEELTTMLV